MRRLFPDNTVMKKFTLVKIKYHNHGIFHEKSKSYLKVYRSGRTISNWTVAHWCFLPMQSQHYKGMWEMVNFRMYQTLQYRFLVRRMRHHRDTHTHNYAARKISSKPLPTRSLLCPKPLTFRSWCLNFVWKGQVGIWSQRCRKWPPKTPKHSTQFGTSKNTKNEAIMFSFYTVRYVNVKFFTFPDRSEINPHETLIWLFNIF